MVSVLADKMDAIRQTCKIHHVVRLDIFGSALREDFKPGRSDVDFLVDFGPIPPLDKPNAYFSLLHEWRNILGTEVDLVKVGALKNRYIRDDVNRTKQQLYGA
ncbi:MAG: nucleotidyltransferase family protein [Cyanobium sp.]